MDAGRVKKGWALAGIAAIGLGLAGWQAADALQNEEAAADNASGVVSNQTDAVPRGPVRVAAAETRGPAPSRGTTPMAQRVAVIGVLNKRNGIERDLTMKPGQALRLGDVIVRLRACEKTAPWEHEQLTGAFVQVDVRNPKDQWGRVFSGWLYKESPSLNVVEHPIYDVWPKSCAMSFPDIGPETETVTGGESSSAPAAAKRSSAPKSGEAEAPTPPASAESSNAT